MANLKFETIVLPKKTQVIVTNSRIPIATATISQLKTYSHIEVLVTASSDQELPDISSLGVIIHFAGFESPSLSDTLSYTTHLYRLLQLAKSYQSQFIMVLPNSRNHLYHSAITMITQFSKNFPLNYQVLEIDPKSDIEETAFDIVKKIIHKHQKPKIVIPEPVIPAKAAPVIKPIEVSPNTVSETKSSNRVFLSILSSLFGLVLAPFLIYLSCFLILNLSIVCIEKSLSSTNFKAANKCSRSGFYAASFMSFSDNLIPVTSTFSSRFGLPSHELATVFQTSSTVTSQLSEVQNLTSKLITDIVSGSGNVSNTIVIQNLLNSLSESLAMLQTDIRSWHAATPNPSSKIALLAENVNQAKTLVSKLQGLSEDWSTFLGVAQKQTYLILIQDNTELRPSGGYIDSLILFTIENGKLTNTKLLTSQIADSQLNGQVEAPPDFKILTGSSQWYLRDVNWDPDFPTTAKRAAWFASKELSQPIDVVLAINQKTLKEWLRILGPVSVSDNKSDINEENITEQSLASLGSSSESILNAITAKIMEKFKSVSPNQLNSLVLSFMSQLETHEILVYPTTFNSLGLESAGWSGGVGLPGCRSQLVCITDYLYATDTNIGVNKTDAYVVKDFDSEITIEPSQITATHSFAYKNTSSQSVWPAGDYKNYLRVYVPQNSKVIKVMADDVELPVSQYSVSSQNGLQLVGISFKVSSNSQTKIQIQTQNSLILAKKVHYQFDLPNQPGSNLTSHKISINYPKEWFTTVYSGQSQLTPSVASPGLLRYNAPTSRPITLDLDIAPNN